MSHHSAKEERIEIVEEHGILSPEEEELKKQESKLNIVQELRDSSEWYETVPHNYLSRSAFEHSLTANTLRGPHKILRRPLKFFNESKTECIIIIHLGDHLCGNNGMVHNGLLATLLDEQLAFVTLPHLPGFTGFTANLDISYLQPVYPNQWIIIKGILNRIEGRKGYATAWIEDTRGTKITESKSLYISPRK
ncbi:HotDog domain-containing protein [Gilbertella persicaria]|uniref:HotDog domain-containing protein n=1 Tax=Gilbertella persicaria TaxID=101096 RepID=UPI00221E9E1C|nr:HotDog domain-containing protein [Gilbertella persicaria]KAI8087676.1 HotDog domain-containing protein [Gilbertella persicaria]